MSEYKNPIDQLIYSTVRIECQTPNGLSTGSGYFFNFLANEQTHVPCIVTNRHVIADSIKGGSLDQPIDLSNAIHVWVKRKLPGIILPDHAKQFLEE